MKPYRDPIEVYLYFERCGIWKVHCASGLQYACTAVEEVADVSGAWMLRWSLGFRALESGALESGALERWGLERGAWGLEPGALSELQN